MQKIEFEVKSDIELIKAIINELPDFSRHDVEKILSNKDVKINGVRAKENTTLNAGDKVVCYYQEKEQKEWFTLVYKDENIIIVNKRAGIEVVSETERDLLTFIRQTEPNAVAAHRIDRNTEGLVIFALNNVAEKCLLEAFKSRTEICKKYALLVHGRVDITKVKRTVYLKKVEALSKVWISEVKTSGYDQIATDFDVVEYRGEKTLLQATLLTGKTHQIRAHIAYYGYPIVGDNKYGKDDSKQMCLTANYLAFNFDKKSALAYLNCKNFEIIPTWL